MKLQFKSFHRRHAASRASCRPRYAHLPTVALAASTIGGLGGCSMRGAPAVSMFGAYFPDWLLFAVLAIGMAIVTRIGFGIAGRADAVPFPLFTCLAVGILIAGAIDFLWLGR